MYKAHVLIRNIESGAEGLDFGEFTINPVRRRYNELRDVFSSRDVNEGDWIFEKSYAQLPPGPSGSLVGGIPNDIEDILLLLRLYKFGDVSFIKLAIIQPSGNILIQLPDRAMNDVNSYSSLRFSMESTECELWKAFAGDIRKSQSWSSGWFAATRRFFLCGGAKQFNPEREDVDRILDYATALESTLVPERDFNARRISHRAARLLASGDPEAEDIVKFVKRFYDIRSRIVHGSGIDEKSREWLTENGRLVEQRVRNVLVTAVQTLPPGDQERRIVLADLYDPTDSDRADYAFNEFKKIKTAGVRKELAAKIAQLAGI
jgi:hypothetical protein